MKSKPFQGIGSWVSGTCRPEDIIPAAMDCLASLTGPDPQQVKTLCQAWDDLPEGDDDEPFGESTIGDERSWIYEQAEQLINENLPPYLYWGSHPGDGADTGVWVSWDSIEDDRRCGDLSSGSELPDMAEGSFLVISDHGNATLYVAADGEWHEVWGCV